jgi:hypothetical protein
MPEVSVCAFDGDGKAAKRRAAAKSRQMRDRRCMAG